MDIRDVVASVLTAAGVAGLAVMTGLLTGSAWWGGVVLFGALVLAGVMLLVSPPEQVVVPPDTPSATPVRTMRTTAPTLGVEVEESRQNVVPKIGHAIGQDPEFYREPEPPPIPRRRSWLHRAIFENDEVRT